MPSSSALCLLSENKFSIRDVIQLTYCLPLFDRLIKLIDDINVHDNKGITFYKIMRTMVRRRTSTSISYDTPLQY